MAARLILNADDFGLTRGINRAIAELHTAGALTSATLMATGPAFDDAVAIARAHPALGVGCHIVLVDGTPAAPLDRVRSLLGPDGKTFRPTLASFLLDLERGLIDENDLIWEISWQIRKLQDAGIQITHLDTHKHTHIWQRIAFRLLHHAEQAGIPAVRNPFEPSWSIAHSGSTCTRALQTRLLHFMQPKFLALSPFHSGTVRTTDGTLGIAATGTLNADTLHDTLAALPDSGTFELLCHPGYNDTELGGVNTRLRQHREIEYQALLAEIPRLFSQPNSAHLIHYGDLAPNLSSQISNL